MLMVPLFTLFLIAPAMADEVAFHQITVEVKNRSGYPIACSAQLAHWFSIELGSAAPEDTISAGFVSDPATGTVFILNDAGERMPLEAAWCGFAGSAWETRSQLSFDGADEIHILCETRGERLSCR
jgi:hypothetical protein